MCSQSSICTQSCLEGTHCFTIISKDQEEGRDSQEACLEHTHTTHMLLGSKQLGFSMSAPGPKESHRGWLFMNQCLGFKLGSFPRLACNSVTQLTCLYYSMSAMWLGTSSESRVNLSPLTISEFQSLYWNPQPFLPALC